MKFVKVLDGNGGSYPFLVQTEEGRSLVVRTKKKQRNSKNLFSEFLARNLACDLGIVREEAFLLHLDREVLDKMHIEFPDTFDRDAKVAVAMDFIPDLQTASSPILPGQRTLSVNEQRSRRRQYILDFTLQNIIPDELYGYFLFAHWALMSDPKYNQLNRTMDGSIVFLDFDGCFGPLWEWDTSELNYTTEAFRINGPIFTEGVLEDISRFKTWYDRLSNLQEEKVRKLLTEVPAEWQVPREFTEKLLELLFGQRAWFLEEFPKYMSWRVKNGCL